MAVCDGNRAWIEWAGFEKDDHRLVEIVCLRLKRLAIAPEDCFSDDGGLGKIVINPFEREGFYLRRIGKTRQRMSLSVDHQLTLRCRMASLRAYSASAGWTVSFIRPLTNRIDRPMVQNIPKRASEGIPRRRIDLGNASNDIKKMPKGTTAPPPGAKTGTGITKLTATASMI